MAAMVRVKKSHRYSAKRQFAPFSLQIHWIFLFMFACSGLLVTTYRLLRSQDAEQGTLRLLAEAHSAAHITAAKKPFLVYGTAWKKENTARFVFDAVHAGFRFVDTACQPKHYHEPGVGEGWKAAAQDLGLSRDDIFLQTKFTPFPGQDPNKCPYDPNSPIEEQIHVSLETSLKNLKTDYLDSYVMHSPYDTVEETMQAWRVMETFVDQGKVRRLGISNCYNYQKFMAIYQQARIKPSVLQNRFYADSNFDTDLRKFCKEHDIWYQSFWTLTANIRALQSAEVKELAEAKSLSPQTYMYAFLMSLGYVTPLSGTTNKIHMAEDVAIMERMQGGEAIFENEADIRRMAQLLGMPDL